MMGDHARPQIPPGPQSLDLTDLGKGEPGVERVSPSRCLSAPITLEVPLLWVLRPCPAHRLKCSASVGSQGPTQLGGMGWGPEAIPSPRLAMCLSGGQGQGHTSGSPSPLGQTG